MRFQSLILLAACLMSFSCGESQEQNIEDEGKMSIHQTVFGRTPDGQEVHLFTCTNQNGMVLIHYDGWDSSKDGFVTRDRLRKLE